MANGWIVGAGLGGFAAVAAGAAGRHLVADAHGAELIDLASRYLMVHSLALLAVALLERGAPARLLRLAGGLFALGMVLFAGGLTLLAATGAPAGALATPFGGTALLLGWLALAAHGLRRS